MHCGPWILSELPLIESAYLALTDCCPGFGSVAKYIATSTQEASLDLKSMSESSTKVFILEVMGRHAGWIATLAGIAGGADLILIPEKPIVMEEVYTTIKKRHNRGKNFSIVVVSEGIKLPVEDNKNEELVLQSTKKDSFGHVMLGGVGSVLANMIEKGTGFESRCTVLGHIQRGGTPTAFDRILSTRFGIAAIDLIHKGEFGKIVVLKGNEIKSTDLKEVMGHFKLVDDYWYDLAKVFFG